MKKTILPLLLSIPLCAFAGERVNVAEDDAASYGDGWKTEGSGIGFGAWKFQEAHGDGESHSGHFIADPANNPGIEAVAPKKKAFGMYANGVSFEASTGFRAFNKPLQKGDSFSFLMKGGPIEKKFDQDDPGTGSIGLTLRNGNISESADDYNKGARFEIGYYEGQPNYQIYDGGENHDSGVPCSEKGITATVTVTDADTYDLEITDLADQKMTKLAGRKFSGTGTIESFCIFNRDGEKSDGFFNGFQVSKESQ